jgi:cysteine synthase
VPEELVENLDLLGFSSISKCSQRLKPPSTYELTENDIVVTVLTDGMELYESRLVEMHEEMGQYTEKQAAVDDARWLKGVTTDYGRSDLYGPKTRS